MSDDKRPIIIKRKKVVGGGGHHGGAWKVAYADFVTAMMAFFMLMWLLNATTENQRKGLADYFNPAIPLTRASGGGEGAMGGSSPFSMEDLVEMGTGGLGEQDGVIQQALGTSGSGQVRDDDLTNAAKDTVQGDAEAAEEEALKAAEATVVAIGIGGDSLVEELAKQQITTKLTDEGLVIEFFDVEDSPLFANGGTEPTDVLRELVAMSVRTSSLVNNNVAVSGYIQSQPIVAAVDNTWDLTTARAQQVRQMLAEQGLDDTRLARVTGHADRKHIPGTPPLSIRNNRIEVTFLRNRR